MDKNSKILAIYPKSIGGRLTMSSIFDGFLSLGYNLEFYDELNPTKLDFSKFDYFLGYDFSAINLNGKKNINYFSDVLYDPHSGENWQIHYQKLKDENNISFYWDEELTKKENNPRICYLPHFVNTDVYKDLNLEPKFDVIFAGRLDTDYRLNTFLEVLQNFKKVGYFAIERHFLDAKNRLKQNAHLLDNVYQGFIDNEKDMALAINQAKVVINFNEQGVGSLNYRTIQTMACKKVMLCDYRQEGVKLFGDDFIYYTDDLIEKIRFYIDNKPIKTLNSLRRVVEENFSHRAGVLRMVDFINQMGF